MPQESIKHFESLQKRYVTQHNGRQCGYVKTALDAMRKRIPQKTKKIPYMYGAENRCPACNHFVGWEFSVRIKFCDECGQALDWSKDNE